MNRVLVFREIILRQICGRLPCRTISSTARWANWLGDTGITLLPVSRGRDMTATGSRAGDCGFIDVTTFKSSVGLHQDLVFIDRPHSLSGTRQWMAGAGKDGEGAKLSKQHGCQLWLNTPATLGVSNSFRLDGCFIKSCKLLYVFMEESLQWRIGSQDSPIHKMALHRQIIKNLGCRRMARWEHMFVAQARRPEFRSRHPWENPGMACIACNFSTGIFWLPAQLQVQRQTLSQGTKA